MTDRDDAHESVHRLIRELNGRAFDATIAARIDAFDAAVDWMLDLWKMLGGPDCTAEAYTEKLPTHWRRT